MSSTCLFSTTFIVNMSFLVHVALAVDPKKDQNRVMADSDSKISFFLGGQGFKYCYKIKTFYFCKEL